MNPNQLNNLLVSVHAYHGDQHQVIAALREYLHHQTRVVVMSPEDAHAEVAYPGIEHRFGGYRAYIGQTSLDRQKRHMEMLLEYHHEYFLMNDSDSFFLCPDLPDKLFNEADGFVWANAVVEPRPHESPYPKIAMQPPYFVHRSSLEKMLAIADKVPAHPITPYIDWWMTALTYEAGLQYRSFNELERQDVPTPVIHDPWKMLEFRIKYLGAVAMHPIKTPEQLTLCRDARAFYEQNNA